MLRVAILLLCVVHAHGYMTDESPTIGQHDNAIDQFDVTCADADNLAAAYTTQTIFEKRLQVEVLNGFHPLILVPEVSALAKDHSENNMFRLNRMNSIGVEERRATIYENSQEWLDYSNLSPDPKYPPVAFTGIQELYGAGANPQAAWIWIREVYAEVFELDHQYIGVGVFCNQTDDFEGYYWVTVILIGSCAADTATPTLYYKDPTSPDSDHACVDVLSMTNDYSTCVADFGEDSSIVLIADSPDGTVGFCCSKTTLNGTNEIPETNSTFTGTAISTVFLGKCADKLCVEVTHDLPTESGDGVDVNDIVTGAHIHLGERDEETEGKVLYEFNGPFTSPFRGCWNYLEEGIFATTAISSGQFYINIHNCESDLIVEEYNGIIRGQISCETSPSFQDFRPAGEAVNPTPINTIP